MVRDYYGERTTGFSRRELESVLRAVEPPACLVGGWAVHFRVNSGFKSEYGRGYIGSRDVDLGVHIDPHWTPSELVRKPVGKSLDNIEDKLGYTRSRFGFLQYFHRESGKRLTEEEASAYSMHEVLEVFVDVVPDTNELDAFKEAFGFRPPAEPLLALAFEEAADPLSHQVSLDVPDATLIPDPALLGAMKVRSIPRRDKTHKRVKDIADLHAILWHVKDYDEIKNEVLGHLSETELRKLEKNVDRQKFETAADLLQIDSGLVQSSIERLLPSKP